jgi:hypothetical protein
MFQNHFTAVGHNALTLAFLAFGAFYGKVDILKILFN